MRSGGRPELTTDSERADALPSSDIERFISATQDPTRRRILLALVGGGERTVDELAELSGVHRTVAFNHLERLTRLGYLEKSKRRGRLGKPATLYRSVGTHLSSSYPQRQFMLLATLLAAGLATAGQQGHRAARAAGVQLGERQPSTGADSVSKALGALAWLGADYAVADETVLARNCVFAEACASSREVICGVQAGLIEGTLHGAGLPVSVQPLGPTSSCACAFRLTPA